MNRTIPEWIELVNTGTNRYFYCLTDIRIVSIMDISSRLDAAMKAAHIPSQSELARRSGVPQPTINRILKGGGKRGPESETLKKLAGACSVSFEWLNEGRGSVAVEQATMSSGQQEARMILAYDDEARLLDLYRRADDRGRREIMGVALHEGGQVTIKRHQA